MGIKESVLVALSGGVDSALAALLLCEDGMEVEGVTFVLWDSSLEKLAGNPDAAAENASRVARTLGIPHSVLDISEGFQADVVDYFKKTYLSGRTPNPCAICNREVKFRYLIDEAMSRGFRFISTGHYVRISGDGQHRQLLRGIDEKRDQSYFLSLLRQEQLKGAIFPLGERLKKDMVRMAKEHALPIQESESREICFLGNNDYRSYLRRFMSDRFHSGDIVDLSGAVLGSHDGFWNYTIGQRRNIGIPAARPYYVVGTNAKENRVIVGHRKDIMKREVLARSFNWITDMPDEKELQVTGMVRYNQKPMPGTAHIESPDTVRMVFDESRFAPAPGQVLTLYNGDEVIGGGIIE